MSYLTSEYEDAIQRARRLSESREKMLTGRGNPANLLCQDDVVIYLRWLVCHLHSVQTVHNFLMVRVPFLMHPSLFCKEASGADFFFSESILNRCCTTYQPVKEKRKNKMRNPSKRLNMLTVRGTLAVSFKFQIGKLGFLDSRSHSRCHRTR